MKLVYQGKTKDVYLLEDGHYLLQFKDDLTGEDGVFDPGANTVGLSISGAGLSGMKMSAYFFRLLQEKGIDSHYINADLEAATMTVRPATLLGKGLEVICRYRAVGSFIRRYGDYITTGSPLPAYVEMTLKDDAKNDPLITKEALEVLGILSPGEYDYLVTQMQTICAVIKDDLAKKGMELYDIKLEFGRCQGQITLIDEISFGSMRVFAGDHSIEPLDLAARILA